MVKMQGSDVYPLQVNRSTLNGQTYYDRDSRGKSWFYLDLWCGEGVLRTKEGGALVLADGGNIVFASERTGGHIPY